MSRNWGGGGAFLRSDIDVSVESPFQLIPKLFDGVEVRAVWASQVLPHQPCIYGLGHSHAGVEKGLPQTVPTKLEA